MQHSGQARYIIMSFSYGSACAIQILIPQMIHLAAQMLLCCSKWHEISKLFKITPEKLISPRMLLIVTSHFVNLHSKELILCWIHICKCSLADFEVSFRLCIAASGSAKWGMFAFEVVFLWLAAWTAVTYERAIFKEEIKWNANAMARLDLSSMLRTAS